MSTRTTPDGYGIGTELSEYDLLLTAIPLPLVTGALAALGGGVSLSAAVGGGGLVSVLLVTYALFVATPGVGGSDGSARE
ncbi:MAG: hypothetical protein ABEJ79_12170 [Halolamina sp.]